MRENDIAYTNLYFSLGIFGIFLSFIFLLVLIYLIINLLSTRINCCLKKRNYLRRKLLYNVWIRYILESYLIVTHYCVFFLSIGTSFDSVSDTINTLAGTIFLPIYILWPFFMILFLYKKQRKLDDKDFIKRFEVMYHENKTRKLSSIFYNSVFCLRRLVLVLSLFLLEE